MYELFGRKPKFPSQDDFDHAWDSPRPLTMLERIGLALFALFVLVCFVAVSTPAKAGVTWFIDTTTPLGGAATFTGATRDIGAGATNWTFFGCQFNADQSGTASIENSTDNVTWLQAATVAVAANVGVDLDIRIRTRYNRCKLLNGATPQGSVRVVSSFRDY